MIDPLEPLLADGVIDEVVARLKSGKEADVWLVRHREELLAAKVYKARHARNFKNNAAYKEGRQVRNTRTQRAMDRGSRFGQAASEDAWKAKESDALHRLYAAGVRVPRPVLFYEGVLLMEVVRDAEGHPAPRLVDAPIAPEQAAALYADLRRQAVRMLACDLIHGDLSPYNVLLGAAGPVVIDFPQVVGAAHNSQAETFFLRDLQNIQRFFAALDPALAAAHGDAREIWRAHVRRELTADFVPTGKPVEPARPPRPQGSPQGQRPGQHGQRPPPQGQRPQPQAPGPHGGAPAQGGGRPPRQARPQQGLQHQGPQQGPPRQGPQQGRPPQQQPPRPPRDARRAPPAPEVVRVVRPPLGAHATGSPGNPPASRPGPHPSAPPLQGTGTGGGPAQPGGGHRRRRRRRGGGG